MKSILSYTEISFNKSSIITTQFKETRKIVCVFYFVLYFSGKSIIIKGMENIVKNGWFYCDQCGKKAFPVLPDTILIRYLFQCKNKHCPKREQIIHIPGESQKVNTQSR